jgi:hypothetical protein
MTQAAKLAALGTSTGTSVLVSGTAVNSTSGTSIDFTGIPSWVKRITVMFNGVSLSGSSQIMVQLGISSGVESTGYSGGTSYGGGGATNFNSAGFQIFPSGVAGATLSYSGAAFICFLGTNTWCESGTISPNATNAAVYSAGAKTLSGTLDRVRITTVNGTDTFDAGSINILYE